LQAADSAWHVRGENGVCSYFPERRSKSRARISSCLMMRTRQIARRELQSYLTQFAAEKITPAY
jgi:hypothetical protein